MTCKIIFIFCFCALHPLAGLEKEMISCAYKLNQGDILIFDQVFEARNQWRQNRKEMYHLVIESKVKAAVLAREEDRFHLAVQVNRRQWNLLNREELISSLGEDTVRSFSEYLDSCDETRVMYVVIDGQGKIINESFSIGDILSYPLPVISRMMHLPEGPFKQGDVFSHKDEEDMKVTFTGVEKTIWGDNLIFTGEFPGCQGRYSFDAERGLPVMFSFTSRYNFFDRDKNEKYFLMFREIKNTGLKGLFREEGLTESVMRASLRRKDFVFPPEILTDFLKGRDTSELTTEAAVCARQGLPPGIDAGPLLRSSNPLVRFNTAKALFLHGEKPEPLKALLEDKNPFIRLRTDRFLKRSLYVLPEKYKKTVDGIGKFVYGRTDRDPVEESLELVRNLMPFIRPPNRYWGEISRFIDRDSEGTIRPFYMRLPRDYDPAEVYPLLIYLDGGVGRSDRGLLTMAEPIKSGGELDHFILLAPQAGGMWWDKATASSFIRAFFRILESASVDTDRIYMTGISNGAMGTFFYASHFPDRFTAIAPLMGHPVVKHTPPETEADREVLKNLMHTWIYMAHGEDDKDVHPYGDRQAYAMLNKLGYPVVYEELPGRGHDLRFSEFANKILGGFAERTRENAPRKLYFVMNLPLNNGCFWVRIDDAENGCAEVKATAEGNAVAVQCNHVKNLSVFLHQKIADLKKEVVITINGKEAYRGIPEAETQTMLETARDAKDPALAYPVQIKLTVKRP